MPARIDADVRPAAARAPYLSPDKRITYSLLRPAGARWWQPATCEQIDCDAWRLGWTSSIDPTTHPAQVHYIRTSGRAFTEERTPDGRLLFHFAAGQPCFRVSEHQVAVEREPLYVVRNGDSRAWTGGGRTHARAEDWRDDFGEHQQKLHDAAQEG